jgi:hypothetical protein
MTMRLEVVQDGRNTVVLIHGRDSAVASALLSRFQSLASGDVSEVALHEVPGVSSLGSCQVVATNQPGRAGIRRVAEPASYRWTQDHEGWLQVAELALPVTKSFQSAGAHFQFLEQQGAEVVFSTERSW